MPHRVILADDSVAIHRVINLTFTGEDVEIVSVHNGTDAIRKANEQQPDLVIADIFMPGLNGYDVCARLRQHAATKSVPVILLVGAFESFDHVKAKEVGATAHIMKPIEPQSLLKLVNGLLNQPRTENGQNAAAAEDADASASGQEPLELVDSPKGQANPESNQMESFINSLQSPATKEPARVFNLSEPAPPKSAGEKSAEPKKIGQENLVAHLSGEISAAEQDDIEIRQPGNQASVKIGIQTDELESLIGGLGAVVEPDATREDKKATTSEDTKPANAGLVVSPELVNEISERVVARLRESLREEVKSAIEDALNEYLKVLDS